MIILDEQGNQSGNHRKEKNKENNNKKPREAKGLWGVFTLRSGRGGFVLNLVGNQSEKTGALKGGFELLLLFLKL